MEGKGRNDKTFVCYEWNCIQKYVGGRALRLNETDIGQGVFNTLY